MTLMGDNAPLRVDPIALAAEAGPQMNSTEGSGRRFRILAQDKQALRNGGSGYGDWRDDRDRRKWCGASVRRPMSDDAEMVSAAPATLRPL